MQLADFGLSVCLGAEASHASNQHHGTALYIAPEVLREGRKSMASDMYACGVVLWELVHGVCAWDHYLAAAPHHSGEQQQGAHLFSFKCAYDLPCMSELVAVSQACMAADPAARPSASCICAVLCDIYGREYGEALLRQRAGSSSDSQC